jgi:hypothetical protein
MGRTALELIGQAGLGNSFDDLEDGDQIRQDPFANAIKALVYVVYFMSLLFLSDANSNSPNIT